MKQNTANYQMPPKYLEFHQELFEDGQTKEKSNFSEHQEDNDRSTSSHCLQNLSKSSMTENKKQSLSSIPECHQQNKKMTSNDRKPTSKTIYLTNIPDSSMCQTLVQDSTSRDQDCYEFWNRSLKETYQQLSWLQKTALPVLGSTSSNGSANNMEPESWFWRTKIQPQKTNSEKTCSPLFKFIVADGMEKEDTKTVKKAMKLRILPTQQQKRMLNEFVGCCRYTYNKCIATFRTSGDTFKGNTFRLRNRYVTLKKRNGTINNFFCK